MNKNLLRAPIELASRFNKSTETQTASYRSDFMRDRDCSLKAGSGLKAAPGAQFIYL